MIHSGLSRLQITLVLPEVSCRIIKKLLITSGEAAPEILIWFVDQNYMPKAWRMWVSIIRGLKQLGKKNISKQSKIATSHKGLIDLKLEDVKTGQSIEEINK
jgi:hypothetical protein